MARTSYANRAQMGHILAAMMPTNALIVRICMRAPVCASRTCWSSRLPS